jgi:predicted PolB exonuclease-like 3'-5' exonuclease
MARSYLVLDIETVRDPALSVAGGPTNDAAGKAPFPPLYMHRPIVLGALWLDEDYRFRRIGVIGEGKSEKAMLEDFSSFVDRYQPDLITYNGRGFDLPVLALRGLRHGVAMSWYYQGRVRHNGNEDGHLDLCDMLSGHGHGNGNGNGHGNGGGGRSLSLDTVARLIGLPGKVGIDGSQVEGLYQAGKLDIIKSYCLADVAQTSLLFLRFRLLQGAMPVVEYRRVAGELMRALRGDRRLEELMGQIDGDRLLAAA